MSRDGRPDEDREVRDQAEMACPLSDADQTRNLLIFAANWALIYLASPVTYVGVVQATLVDRLGFSNEVANRPASVYLWSMLLAVVVSWLFPQVGRLKPLLVTALLAAAAMGGAVAAAIL